MPCQMAEVAGDQLQVAEEDLVEMAGPPCLAEEEVEEVRLLQEAAEEEEVAADLNQEAAGEAVLRPLA